MEELEKLPKQELSAVQAVILENKKYKEGGQMHNVQQRQRLIPSSVYKQELAKCRLGDNIANHMGYIFTAILYDKFEMTFKQVTNFYSKTVERRKSWQDDDDEAVTSESMMAYCRKKKIDVVKWVK